MIASRWLRRIAPYFLCLALIISACTAAPSKYDQVQEETTGRDAPAAVAKEAQKGGTFNQFFPPSGDGYEVVPAQEKKGFAEYKLKQGGETLAMLTINDTVSVPAAAAKYQNSGETLAGYPLVDQGQTASGLLVNGRYQVKVLSRDPDFSRDQRLDWLQKFDLEGIAQLESAQSQQLQTPQARQSRPQAPALPQPSTEPQLQPAA